MVCEMRGSALFAESRAREPRTSSSRSRAVAAGTAADTESYLGSMASDGGSQTALMSSTWTRQRRTLRSSFDSRSMHAL